MLSFKKYLTLLSFLILVGAGCAKQDAATQQASERMDFNVWGVIDDSEVYQPILDEYRKAHPNLQINYRRLRLEEYEKELIEALAEDRGPDIFLIHNDWAGKYLTKIAPMPASTKIVYSVVTGTIKKQQSFELRTEPTISLKSYKDQFADVVIKDTVRAVNISTKPDQVILQPRIIGLPVGIDTLALYYNKDLLNAAGIPNPPTSWGEFQEQVKKLRKLDDKGNIVQAGAGIGTARNVERSTDILAVLMMQNGAEMADDQGYPTFQTVPLALQDKRENPPANEALEFYTDFANPDKVVYTWNNSEPNSLDAFVRGTSAFFFGYSYHLPQIRASNPKLHIGIAALPQIEGNPTRNYANYWFWVVSKKAKDTNIAWNFLNFLIKPEQSKKILDVVKHPAARKLQLKDQAEDEDVGVFAGQVLTAQSWYRGRDPQAVEEAFQTLIEDIVNGRSKMHDAIRFAVEKIGQTIE